MAPLAAKMEPWLLQEAVGGGASLKSLFTVTNRRTAGTSERVTLASLVGVIRGHVKEFIVIGFIVIAVPLGAWGFNVYTDQMFFNEGSEHLATTYRQVANTFELFTNRNWNFLEAWEENLKYISDATGVEDTWHYYADLKDTWHYSDFYLFNENDEFSTASGRSGTADSIKGVFEEMYEGGSPLVSSYIASSGVRKIVFAQPLESPIVMDGVTYTGVALSYDNDYVQGLITSDIYSDASDCYVVRQDGSVVFSLSSKSIFTDFVVNLDTFLGDDVTFERGSYQEIADSIANAEEGSVLISYDGLDCYVVFQPAGILDWTIASVVRADAVDANLDKVKLFTIVAQSLLAIVLFAGVLVILLEKYHRLMAQEKEGRRAAEKSGEMTRDLLEGMAKIADRYIVVNLVNGTYEYHENLLEHGLYPESGLYRDLLDTLTHRYAALTDTDDAKMARLLSADVLRRDLKTKDNRIKIEYASRTEPVFMLMTAVPVYFASDGKLERVLLIGQDIGLRKELESEANTDALTGLFNKRYFTNVLAVKRRKQIPFTLLFIDLDRFKPVNDTYGHTVGDMLLKQVGGRLQDCVRAEDFAFRLGGDEFAIIVTGQLDAVRAGQVRERVRRTLCEPYVIDGVEIEIGASCGCASWPQESASIREIHELADQRMYADKEARHKLYGGDGR